MVIVMLEFREMVGSNFTVGSNGVKEIAIIDTKGKKVTLFHVSLDVTPDDLRQIAAKMEELNKK